MFQGSGRGSGRSGRGGRGRGRDGRGRGRGPHHNNKPQPALFLCRHFVKGTCNHGDQCTNSHAIKQLFKVNASDAEKQKQQHSYNGYDNNYHNGSKLADASDIAVWDKEDGFKIFTASYDGQWRLWNPVNGNLTEEFKNNMGGKIETITVKQGFLFCGFEGTAIKVPDVSVGMIHAWNLNSPSDPPIEFHMHDLAPYAHAKRVTAFTTHQDMCISGSQDGTIRIWKYDVSQNGGKGGFLLIRECSGHAGEVTGLVMIEKNMMLWSCSTDMTIRLWDGNSNWDCKYMITRDAALSQGQQSEPTQPAGQGSQTVGHADAITSLTKFDYQNGCYVLSSSLDGHVKIWDGENATCVSTSENHGEGIVSMAISADTKGSHILLCGTVEGNIHIRNLMPTPTGKATLSLMAHLHSHYSDCHKGAVKSIQPGPGNTFYSAGSDGVMNIWQILGDLCK